MLWFLVVVAVIWLVAYTIAKLWEISYQDEHWLPPLPREYRRLPTQHPDVGPYAEVTRHTQIASGLNWIGNHTTGKIASALKRR